MRLVVALVSIVSLSLVACGPSRRDRSAHNAQNEDDDDGDFISKKKGKKSGGGDAGDIVGWKRVVGEEDARTFVPLFGKAARIHGCHVQENGAAVVADCDGKDIRMVRDGGKILIGCKGWGTLEQCQQLFNDIIESAKKQTAPPGGNQASGNPPSGPSAGAAYAAAPVTAGSSTLKAHQTMPVALGTARDAVRSSFGKPNYTGANFDSFVMEGLAIDYQSDVVISVTGTYMNSGAFRGRMLGVGLAEPLARCVEEWGTPVARTPSGYEFDNVTWIYGGYTIEVELWNKDSFQSTFGGDMKKDTVKRIKVRR